MNRAEILRSVLTSFTQLRPRDAVQLCDLMYARDHDAYVLALKSIALAFAQRFEDSSDAAAEARDRASDPEALLLALAATAWADTARLEQGGGDPIEEALAIVETGPVDSNAHEYVLYLLAESALGSARLDLAERIVERSGGLPLNFLKDASGKPHPYLGIMYVMRARLLAFRGRISEAIAIIDRITVVPGSAIELVVSATRCLLVGNNAERQSARVIADRLERDLGEPTDYLSAGCYVLVSYGLVAMGDVSRAATFVIRAGHTAGLEGLNVIDRALGLEMLVAAAILEEDVNAARAWQVQAEPLLSHPVSRPTIERLNSRVALAGGDAQEAARWAELAVVHATDDGRAIEASEGEIVLSRARVAMSERGEASSRLEAMAARARTSGHLSAEKAAARELRVIGRRLRPASGSGWTGLSPREREVALLVAEGFGNQAIARALHLSEHTVQSHVSRVLAAFGAASRLSVAAQLASMLPTEPAWAPQAPLTARQQLVANRIAEGRTNDAIALDLGVSVKTVEKHVSEILRRWQVASRIGIARVALSQK